MSERPEVGKQLVLETYGRLPLSFEANHGQTDGSVKFLSRGNGYTLFLTANEAVLTLRRSQESEVRSQNQSPDREGGGIHPSRTNPSSARLPRAESRGQRVGYPQVTQIPPIVIPRSVSDEGPVRSSPSVPSAKSADLYRLAVDETAVLRMKLVGANPNPAVTGLAELSGKSNYFIGNDPSKWRTNVPTYAKVKYEDVYPGIDLVYYGAPAPAGRGQRQLEYDFVVAPGADPRAITLDFAGAQRMEIDPQGELALQTSAGEVRLHKPVVYQEVGGIRQMVDGHYVRRGKEVVGFAVASYDPRHPLIIDPVLVYSTYLGGSGNDRGFGIAVDTSGNAYVTGDTQSATFPGTSASSFQAAIDGGLDAFITKLNAAGSSLVYSTYLGGSGSTSGNGIAVDSLGNAYVTGWTESGNFPGTSSSPIQSAFAGVQDAFVTKLNAAGSALVYSTYLGGSSGENYHPQAGIAVDPSGNAYVTGTTFSRDFPLVNAFQPAYGGSWDAFVAKLNPAGSALVYSTYLGGSGTDKGFGIAVDSSGNAYVTGGTGSTNFPTANALQAAFAGGAPDAFSGADAFVTKLNAAGSALVYSTYLGGSSVDQGNGIAVDSTGNAYVTGDTLSGNFPTANAFQSTLRGHYNAFVTKLNAAGTALVYSTYLGGGAEGGHGIAVDSAGNAYVTGTTFGSTDFPTANAFQAALGGADDAFAAKLDTNATGVASLVYSTYLGGNSFEERSSIAVDSSGNAYVTGYTTSANFPTANAFQAAFGGSTDAFVSKIFCQPPNSPPVITSVSGPTSPIALGNAATVSANFTDADAQDTHTCTFAWDDSSSSPGAVTEPTTSIPGQCMASHTYATAGVYAVAITVTDNSGASASTTFESVVIFAANAGFITGGGWINSPASAYAANRSLSGKANFGFVSKYQKGANTPTGQTEFQFPAANFNFHSSVCEWLVVAGAMAQYKGSGTVNGAGNYGFLLTATDRQLPVGGGVDKFRIKIWNKATNAVIYDNVGGSDDIDSANPQAISGGSIVIHNQ
ncbi:MAG: hypothetical protein A3H28_11940 [Acidobacteria bacterium RIFCSPLOWO2_02_FULL_61_28]|nr:MAG: hypothetical protein A3H28_11940 [Acidobacteria bacterium RIFCSPLOWO2_02_FULL_61_28]